MSSVNRRVKIPCVGHRARAPAPLCLSVFSALCPGNRRLRRPQPAPQPPSVDRTPGRCRPVLEPQYPRSAQRTPPAPITELVGQLPQSWSFALVRAGPSHQEGAFYRTVRLAPESARPTQHAHGVGDRDYRKREASPWPCLGCSLPLHGTTTASLLACGRGIARGATAAAAWPPAQSDRHHSGRSRTARPRRQPRLPAVCGRRGQPRARRSRHRGSARLAQDGRPVDGTPRGRFPWRGRGARLTECVVRCPSPAPHSCAGAPSPHQASSTRRPALAGTAQPTRRERSAV